MTIGIIREDKIFLLKQLGVEDMTGYRDTCERCAFNLDDKVCLSQRVCVTANQGFAYYKEFKPNETL